MQFKSADLSKCWGGGGVGLMEDNPNNEMHDQLLMEL